MTVSHFEQLFPVARIIFLHRGLGLKCLGLQRTGWFVLVVFLLPYIFSSCLSDRQDDGILSIVSDVLLHYYGAHVNYSCSIPSQPNDSTKYISSVHE